MRVKNQFFHQLLDSPDILLVILTFFSPYELCLNISRISKSFYELSNHGFIWQIFYDQLFHKKIPNCLEFIRNVTSKHSDSKESWKQKYISKYFETMNELRNKTITFSIFESNDPFFDMIPLSCFGCHSYVNANEFRFAIQFENEEVIDSYDIDLSDLRKFTEESKTVYFGLCHFNCFEEGPTENEHFFPFLFNNNHEHHCWIPNYRDYAPNAHAIIGYDKLSRELKEEVLHSFYKTKLDTFLYRDRTIRCHHCHWSFTENYYTCSQCEYYLCGNCYDSFLLKDQRITHPTSHHFIPSEYKAYTVMCDKCNRVIHGDVVEDLTDEKEYCYSCFVELQNITSHVCHRECIDKGNILIQNLIEVLNGMKVAEIKKFVAEKLPNAQHLVKSTRAVMISNLQNYFLTQKESLKQISVQDMLHYTPYLKIQNNRFEKCDEDVELLKITKIATPKVSTKKTKKRKHATTIDLESDEELIDLEREEVEPDTKKKPTPTKPIELDDSQQQETNSELQIKINKMKDVLYVETVERIRYALEQHGLDTYMATKYLITHQANSTLTLSSLNSKFPSILLKPNETIIVGRCNTLPVEHQINDPRVSTKHFELKLDNSGVVKIKDTSRNGTLVDGKALQPQTETILQLNQKITLVSHDSLQHSLPEYIIKTQQ